MSKDNALLAQLTTKRRLDDLDLVLHKIRAKLYPNHLQKVEGNYIARTNNEKTLDQNDIATTAKTRGGRHQRLVHDLPQHRRRVRVPARHPRPGKEQGQLPVYPFTRIK